MANSVVLWAGPSVLDQNERIVVIGTGKSKNTKTGNMKQVWFLPMRTSPHESTKNRNLTSVCGDCPFQPHSGHERWSGRCYVNRMCPNHVWKSWRHGYMDIVEPETFGDNSFIRVGAWGDPASVPLEFFGSLLKFSRGWTSYTHMWKTCNPGFKSFCMASVQSRQEMKSATLTGWRTFRVLDDADEVVGRESLCRNYVQGIKCVDCLLCCGLNSSFSCNVATPDHCAITMSAKARRKRNA